MKKIAFITNSIYAWGGEERVVLLIANELAKENEVTIYSLNRCIGLKNEFEINSNINIVEYTNYEKYYTFLRKAIMCYEYRIAGIPIFLRNWVKYPSKYLKEWIEELNRGEYDFVISVSGDNTMLLSRIGGNINSTTIGWQHNSLRGYFDNKSGTMRNREKEYKKYIHQLDEIVVLTESISDEYSNELEINPKVIVNPKTFFSEQKICIDNKTFVACGRLVDVKGFVDLVLAFSKLKREGLDWKLVIIGDGIQREKILQIAKDNNVEEYVHITGFVADVKRYMLQGSVLVQPSRYEGLPMVTLEAFELGMPIVAYDIPSFRFLLGDEKAGLLAKSNNIEELKKQMKKLALDNTLRAKLAEGALEKSKEYEIDKVIEQWKELLGV